MIQLPGGAAFSSARLQKRLLAVRRSNPGVRSLTADFRHFVDVDGPADRRRPGHPRAAAHLRPAPSDEGAERGGRGGGPALLVVPRLGTVSPWSSKATDIAHICGLERVRRIERGIVYVVAGEVVDEAALRRALHDRMTESVLDRQRRRRAAVRARGAAPARARGAGRRWPRARCAHANARAGPGALARRDRLPGRRLPRRSAATRPTSS